MKAGRALDRGHLRIGTDSPSHTAPLLAAFTQLYPGPSLSLATGNSDEMLEALLDYRTDVAIIAKTIDLPEVESFKLHDDPLVLFVERGHPLARRASQPLAAIKTYRLVLREAGSITRALFERALREQQITPAEIMEIDSREAVHEAVAAGLGVGVVARSEVVNDPRLQSIRIRDADLIMTEYVLCLRERRRLPVVQAFLSIARGVALNSGG